MSRMGMVHGRFQPFTIGHMEYVSHVLGLVDRLVVGITNPVAGISEVSTADDHRHLASSNPYSYYDRYRMVQESIACDPRTSCRCEDISIVPLFLDDEESWSSFLPEAADCVQYINLFDGWDEEKRRRFERSGYRTEPVNLPRITSATEVRRLMDEGDSSWEFLVPEGTRRVLRGDICGF